MNELQRSGAQPGNKQGKFAPIWVGSLRSGLVTNRSPLIGSTAPRLMEKFYGTSGDLLIAGSNVEISSRFSLIRRFGNSVYNGGSFTGVDSFTEFRLQNGTIKVIADTAAIVKDITGSNNISILTKGAGSGQTYFQSVLNTLFMGDGVEQKKYAYNTNVWTALTAYAPALAYSTSTLVQPGFTLIDVNGNLQVLTAIGTSGGTQPTWAVDFGATTVDSLPNRIPDSNGTSGVWTNGPLTFSPTGGAVAGGKWTFTGTGTPSGFNFNRSVVFGVTPGATYTLSGYIDASQVSSGVPVWELADPTVTTAYGSASQSAGTSGRVVSAPFTVPGGVTQVVVVADTGNCTINNTQLLAFSDPQLELGSSVSTYDNTSSSPTWKNYGSPLQNWGIATPATAPVGVNAALTSPPFPFWVASTFYAPSVVQITDPNNNIQALTTSGTTGGSQPTWNVTTGGTTTDGSAVWTNKGIADWQANHAYALGDIVAATFTVQVSAGGQPAFVTYSDSFLIFQAGTSGSSAPSWQPGNGSRVNDGSAIWLNINAQNTWATIGATTLVTTVSAIQDSNGNVQLPGVPGKTGSLVPVWKTAYGAQTADNAQKWFNAGPLAAGATGAAGTGAWVYGYAYKNSVANTVSSMSAKSNPVILAANSFVIVQGQGCPDPQCDTVIVFRTTQGFGNLFWMTEIPNPGANQIWTVNDLFPDSALNEFIPAPINGLNDPPPVGLGALAYHLNRVWGRVGNIVYYSNTLTTVLGAGSEQFPFGSNFFVYPSVVTRLEPTSSGMLVFTTSDIYMIAGQGTATSILYSYQLIPGIGLLSYNAFSKSGSTFYLLNSAKKLISLDPSAGYTEPGYPIGDRLMLLNPMNAYVTWHDGGATDTALFLADGSTGWYRLAVNPNSSVESPMIWSTFATITNGCKAVQSIEVSPGSKQLLVGPAETGPILKRDGSVSQDNGVSYAATATIGSIVLAEPGQMAEVSFVACDSVAVSGSSKPALSVIFDEALPYYTGPFFPLVNLVNDPPRLAPSISLYSNRYYINQAQVAAWCRHMQLQISWPAEDFQNELLSLAIYGAIWIEK